MNAKAAPSLTLLAKSYPHLDECISTRNQLFYLILAVQAVGDAVVCFGAYRIGSVSNTW